MELGRSKTKFILILVLNLLVHSFVQAQSNCGTTGMVINSDVDWSNQTLNFEGVVTVESGGILNITNSDITFANSANIVVEDGGLLRIWSSTLSPNECATQWPGIRATGTGSVLMNSSRIINAEIGVESNYGVGEVLRLRSNDFDNNETAIRVAQSIGEISFLILGNFIHSVEYWTDRGIDLFEVDILDSAMQTIDYNNFNHVKFGIYAQDVQDGEVGVLYNVFNDILETGIRFNNSQPFNSQANLRLNIRRNVMDDMKRGIIARKLHDVSITDNRITTISHTGITLNDLTKHDCSGNRIAGFNTGNQPSLGNRGISISGGVFSSNNHIVSIERDTIIRFKFGIHLNNYPTNSSNIETHCNLFNNNERAIGIFNNSHFDQQGDSDNATYNVFLNSAITDIDVYTNSSMGDYHFASCGVPGCEDFKPSITGQGLAIPETVLDIMVEFCSFNPVLMAKATPANERIELIPNPTPGHLKIQIPLSDEMASIVLLNTAGQILREEKIARQTGSTTMDLSQFPDGIYFIQYINGNENMVERVVLAR